MTKNQPNDCNEVGLVIFALMIHEAQKDEMICGTEYLNTEFLHPAFRDWSTSAGLT